MSSLVNVLQEIVVANRILAREDVVDAFGHVSVRHPENKDRYLMSRSRSPELVTVEDIMEFSLTGEIIGGDTRKPYAERHIHGAIFEKRRDVNAVVHNHSHAVIPFSVTDSPLRPLMHVTGVIGQHVPVWDIEENFGSTSLLVTNMEQGRDLANKMGSAAVILMRGHGCAIGAADIRAAVLTAIYTQVNAKLQLQAMPLGDVKYLSAEEISLTPETLVGTLAMERAWEYFERRATSELL
ncbi:MAG: class II aldolase/adducin family protein [Pseudomonadota bacterium]|nr:class II aldolase/adducin family protein [Pseudomonadota bacterium]